MSEISISAEDYAANFPNCKAGEVVTGTFSGTVTAAGPEGATIETESITKDEGDAGEGEAPAPAPKPKGPPPPKRGPAVMAALKGEEGY